MTFAWALGLRRWLAAWVDMVLVGLIATYGGLFGPPFLTDALGGAQPGTALAAIPLVGPLMFALSFLAAWFVSFAALTVLYAVVMERLGTKGTLGKLVFRLAVANADDNRRSLWRIAIRNVLKLFVMLCVVLAAFAIETAIRLWAVRTDPDAAHNVALNATAYSYFIGPVLGYLYAAAGFGRSHRALHDILSRTRVLRRAELAA